MPEQSHTSAAPAKPSGNPLIRPEPGLAIWTVITFVLLLLILKKIAWTPILDTLDRREKAIKDALAEADKARAAAAVSIEEQQKLLAEARRDAQDLLARSRAEAERSRDDLIARARGETEKMVAAGKQAIEQEKRAAILEVRKSTVDLALLASAKLMKSTIDEGKSRELVAGYIRELEGKSGTPS
jgi:F-type H+-transporting ATPase subunit b